MNSRIQKIFNDFLDQLSTEIRQEILAELQSSLGGVARKGRPPGVQNANSKPRKPRKPLTEEQKEKLRNNLAKARDVRAKNIKKEKQQEKAAKKAKPKTAKKKSK